MSLDLVKNALYQAITTAIPGLTFYPEVVDSKEAFPNLQFQTIDTVRMGIRHFEQGVLIPTGQALPNPPNLYYPVLEQYRTKLTLQLRDSIGTTKNAAAYQKVRDTFNKVDRFFARSPAVSVGGQTIADLNYQGNRPSYDSEAGVVLHSLEVDVEWCLLDDNGLPAFTASTVQIDIGDLATGNIRITQLLTP